MKGIYLEKKNVFVEDESFQMTFLLKDDKNDPLTSNNLSSYKFYAYLDNYGNQIIKKDANYTDGAATQVTTSGNTVIVYITEDETDGWNGKVDVEVVAVNKTDGNKYVFYRDKLTVIDSIQD